MLFIGYLRRITGKLILMGCGAGVSSEMINMGVKWWKLHRCYYY
jgi:hypothetical protein